MSGAPEREPGWTQPFPSESRGPKQQAPPPLPTSLESACPFIPPVLYTGASLGFEDQQG